VKGMPLSASVMWARIRRLYMDRHE